MLRAMDRSRFALVAFVLGTAIGAPGCPKEKCINILTPELRWSLFASYGAPHICPEMLKRGLPLRLQDGAPVIGRFFPTQCSHQIDNGCQTVSVTFAGNGYGYVSPVKRVSFWSSATVEYKADIKGSDDGDVYVWGQATGVVQGPTFQITYMENNSIPALGSVANYLGNYVVGSELARGFTVVHNESKGDTFALGHLQLGEKPYAPWSTQGTKRYTYANEQVEVHAGQRDYLGPFEVKDGKTLYVSATSRGPTIDLMIVDKTTGDWWRDGYQKGVMAPPQGPILGGQPVGPYPANLSFRLAPGSYYVVVDNSPSVGNVAPPVDASNPLSDAVAVVSYVAQLGD